MKDPDQEPLSELSRRVHGSIHVKVSVDVVRVCREVLIAIIFYSNGHLKCD